MESPNKKSSRVCLCIVMGPSGCGKTTIGQALANKLSAPFLEGDHFHPKANVDKMSNGIPLTDDDRWPWLADIGNHCQSLADQFRSNDQSRAYIVITCSALKQSYRALLRNIPSIDRTVFIYAKGSFELIHTRISQRQNHFMKPQMLSSQFAALESPEGEHDVVCVDVSQPIDDIISQIVAFVQ